MCKLTPITSLIEDNYAENGCLTFIGQRKYESLARAKSERVWRSQAVPNQIGAAPIQDWTALHVWLYIFREKLPYNPLYEKGFDRIGCWLCPAASLADFMNLRITHPTYMAELDEKLRPYAEDKGNPEEWIRYGFWRFGKLPAFMQHIAEAKGITAGSPAADAPAEKTGERSSGSGYPASFRRISCAVFRPQDILSLSSVRRISCLFLPFAGYPVQSFDLRKSPFFPWVCPAEIRHFVKNPTESGDSLITYQSILGAELVRAARRCL